MRIAFLCGSLEAGRDGVGDYTIGLAEELCVRGHRAMVIGLRDKFVGQPVSIERPASAIPILRLPAALEWGECVTRAGQALDSFAPEWISLQFVCYTFHPKGLVHGLARNLAPLLTDRKLHVMFHELWLCRELGWGGRHRAIGVLQRFLIKQFIAAVKPEVIHTSNATYAALLNRSGIPATILELFGAIPISPVLDTAWIETQLRVALGGEYRRDALWLFGFFGALHTQWPPEPLLTHIHLAAQASGRKPVLLSIGRMGTAGEELWNRLAHEQSDRFTFLCLGEQTAEHISEYLSFLDCGIATTQRSIIGKSSTAISMLEHGLPVIVNRSDAPVAGFSPCESMLLVGDASPAGRFACGVPRGSRQSRRPAIVDGFVAALQAGGQARSCDEPLLKLTP